MKNPKTFVSILLMVAALIQWLGIGERLYHALWQWYKFKETSGDGYTTVSYTMALVTYSLSALLIGVGLIITKQNNGEFVHIVSRISTVSLVIGVLIFSLLLLSPFGELVAKNV